MKKLKHTLIGLLFLGLAACGGGGSSSNQSSNLSGLSSCEVAGADQAVVCGTVLANDGVTPLVNAEITLAGSSRPVASARGVANDDKCLTDGAGDFVCVLPSGVSGEVTLKVSLNGFDDTTLTVTATEGEVTETGGQNLSGNTNNKWVVVPGAFDGVQVLLAQLKGCTLTGPTGAAYISGTDPSSARGSTDCESKGLTVLDDSQTVEGFLATNELLSSDSLFINCQADYSTPAIDSLLNSFVDQGGHVYFSDRSDTWLTKAFPDKVTFGGRATTSGTITADIETAGLASVIGNSVDIIFDLGVWTVISSVASDVTTFIQGNVSNVSTSTTGVRPITVGWKEDGASSGCVFYTSFHIEGAETVGALQPQELAIKYLIQNIESVCQ